MDNNTHHKALASSIHQSIHQHMIHSLVFASPEMTIVEAAQCMQKNNISALLILENENLIGIVTDRDLRNRVLAANLEAQKPVRVIMSSSPQTISADKLLFDAQVLMMEKNIHHLPVVEPYSQRPVGIVTVSDIYRANSAEPLSINRALLKAENIEQLVEESKNISQLFIKLALQHHTALDIGLIISQLSDTLTKALIQLAIKKYGPAPCEYAWLVFGSQARSEQLLSSDQDSGLLLANNASEQDREYFALLTTFVTEGLHACGIPRCQGGIMASNPTWQLTLEQWQEKFTHWLDERTPKDLLNCSIFFDARHCIGNADLSQSLLHFVQTSAQKNTIFLALLAKNALLHTPPLGLFNQFILDNTSKERGIELKKGGSLPLIDIARLLGLQSLAPVADTTHRLRHAAKAKCISEDFATSLIEAHAFIAKIRIEHQVEQFRKKEILDNTVAPQTLSSLKRSQLKKVLKQIKEAQNFIRATLTHDI